MLFPALKSSPASLFSLAKAQATLERSSQVPVVQLSAHDQQWMVVEINDFYVVNSWLMRFNEWLVNDLYGEIMVFVVRSPTNSKRTCHRLRITRRLLETDKKRKKGVPGSRSDPLLCGHFFALGIVGDVRFFTETLTGVNDTPILSPSPSGPVCLSRSDTPIAIPIFGH